MKIKFVTAIALATAFGADIRYPAEASQPCGKSMAEIGTTFEQPLRVFANRIKVTGDTIYSVGVVRRNLRITDGLIRQLQDKEVLLVAEGFSGLLPYLLKNGVERVEALDVWYHDPLLPAFGDGFLMRQFVERYSKYLVQGSAFHLPYENESKDAIFSHMFVNHFSWSDRDTESAQSATNEILRVLRRGGIANVFGYEGIPRRFLNDLESRGIEVSYSFLPVVIHPDGRPVSVNLGLLEMKKL